MKFQRQSSNFSTRSRSNKRTSKAALDTNQVVRTTRSPRSTSRKGDSPPKAFGGSTHSRERSKTPTMPATRTQNRNVYSRGGTPTPKRDSINLINIFVEWLSRNNMYGGLGPKKERDYAHST